MARAVTLVLVLVLLLAACTSATGAVSADGGTFHLDDDERVQLVVPPGAAEGSVDVELTTAGDALLPNPGTTPLGPAVEVTVSSQLVGTSLRMPLPRDQIVLDGSEDFFLAVYNETWGVWVPLVTEYDPEAGAAVTTPPHFSRFGLFKFDVPDVGGGLAWAGEKVGDVAHDAAGGVKNFADGMLTGMVSWVQGGELKKADCAGASSGWTVESTAAEITGCVVGDRVRVGSTYRTPFWVRVPPGSDIGPNDSDFELDTLDYVMRGLNGAIGVGTLAQRNNTSVGLPAGPYGLGEAVGLELEPDLLGTALQIILGLLSGMPGKKELTTTIDRSLVDVLWNARDQSVTVTLQRYREAFTQNLGKTTTVEQYEQVMDMIDCAAKNIQGAVNTVRKGEAEEAGKAIVEVATACTGEVLGHVDKSFDRVWEWVSGVRDTGVAVYQTVKLIGLGLNHFGGRIDLVATRADATLPAGTRWDDQTVGFGEVRPSELFLGGASATGGIEEIDWDSWGGPEATGTGRALYVPPGGPNAAARSAEATVALWDVGDCAGRPAYRKVDWYFPAMGEQLDRSQYFNACTGLYSTQGG